MQPRIHRRINRAQHVINGNLISLRRFGNAGRIKGRDGFTGLNLTFRQGLNIRNHIFQHLRHATRRISRAQQITLCSVPGF